MEPLSRLILSLFLIVCVISTGCISDDTPAPATAPVAGDNPQKWVLIQNIGNVTGQGVILQGVPRGTIDTITFTIGLAPGAKPLEMANATIVYSDAVRTEILEPVQGYRGIPPPGYWGIIDTVNEPGGRNLRLEFDKQFVIRINPKAAIVPNQVITISIKPTEGKPLILRRVAPSAIEEDDNILPGL
jgi:archaellin